MPLITRRITEPICATPPAVWLRPDRIAPMTASPARRRGCARWPSSSIVPEQHVGVRFLRKVEIARWALAQPDTPREA